MDVHPDENAARALAGRVLAELNAALVVKRAEIAVGLQDALERPSRSRSDAAVWCAEAQGAQDMCVWMQRRIAELDRQLSR